MNEHEIVPGVQVHAWGASERRFLGGLRLVDAGLFRGATISREQAGQLLGELGLYVR